MSLRNLLAASALLSLAPFAAWAQQAVPSPNGTVIPTVGAFNVDVAQSQSLALTSTSNTVTILIGQGEATLGITTSGISASGSTVTFNGSRDGVTFNNAIIGYSDTCGISGSGAVTSDLGQGIHFNVAGYRAIQFKVGTAGTGTATITSTASVAPFSCSQVGANVTTPNFTAPTASAAGTGATVTTIVAAATTNATLVSTGIHTLYGLQCGGTNTVARWIKFFNKATAPVPGTDTPVTVFYIPANTITPQTFDLPSVGMAFATGLGYDITTNPALADATALSAADTFCTLEYK